MAIANGAIFKLVNGVLHGSSQSNNNLRINDELMQFVYKHVSNSHVVPKRQLNKKWCKIDAMLKSQVFRCSRLTV